MPASPLAYFITFSTYGAWLHGRDIGSVDKGHNQVEMPYLTADKAREGIERDNMREPPYILDAERRNAVLKTILEVAHHRKWKVWACHVRSTHAHIIVTAEAAPEKVMIDFKAYASRRLKERFNERADRKRWTQHGSTRYLWEMTELGDKIEYVVNGQGAPMSVYRYDPDAPSE